MRIPFLKYPAGLLAVLFVGCELNSDPSPHSAINLQLTSITSDKGAIVLEYDNQGRLSHLSNSAGDDYLDLFYLGGGTIKGSANGDDPKGVNDITNESKKTEIYPYNIVMKDGNPIEMNAIELSYTFENGTYREKWTELFVTIDYDNKVNPIYLVLEQSQMIPTVDDLILFSPNPVYEALQTKGLVAKNNPLTISTYSTTGKLLGRAVMSYQYNDEGLPLVCNSLADNQTQVTQFSYTEID